MKLEGRDRRKQRKCRSLLLLLNRLKNAGRVRQTPEELQETYSKLKRLTGGGVFRNGNGRLGEEIRDAVVRNENTKIEKANKSASNKRKARRKLFNEYQKVKALMRKPTFQAHKLNNTELRTVCLYKKQTGDAAVPTKKDALLIRLAEVKNRASPPVSHHGSDSEDSDDEDGPAKIDPRQLLEEEGCDDNGSQSQSEEELDDASAASDDEVQFQCDSDVGSSDDEEDSSDEDEMSEDD